MGHYCYKHLNFGVEDHIGESACIVYKEPYPERNGCSFSECPDRGVYRTDSARAGQVVEKIA